MKLSPSWNTGHWSTGTWMTLYEEYEREKKRLEKLPADEYERKLTKIVKKLSI
jgi:hypothetical protein